MYNNKSILSKSAEILIDIGCVNFDIEKKFKLTSGKYSPVYCDCRKIISFPKQREILMDFSIKLIKSQKYFKDIFASTNQKDYKGNIKEESKLPKNVVASKIADKCLIQLAYAIGVSKPLSIFIKLADGDEQKVDKLKKNYS